MALWFQTTEKSHYAIVVYLKTVCKKPQPDRLYVCSKAAAASLKVLSFLENLNLPSPCLNAPSTSSNWVQRCWRCTQPAPSLPGCPTLLPERLNYCQSLGPGSKASWHGNGGEGMGWKGNEKRKWRHKLRCTSGSWKGGEKLWLGFQVRSESWKWEIWGRNDLAKKLELREEGTWVWGLGGGSCCLKDKRKAYWGHSE